mgnify:CR=1 FL=1
MVSILRALSVVLPALTGWVRRNPWPALAIVLVAACAWSSMLASDRNGSSYEPGHLNRHTFVFDLLEVF